MKKVGIVGHFGFGHDLLNGQTIKVKILFQEFQKQLGAENTMAVDTHGGVKKVPAMIAGTIKMFQKCENCMVLPAYKGVLIFTPLFSILNKIYHRKTYYIVVGGWLDSYLDKYKWLEKQLKNYTAICVETTTMKKALEKRGFNNIELMANCKELAQLSASDLHHSFEEPYALCTFSRVMKGKGIENLISVIKKVNEKTGSIVYTLDIYGEVWKDYTYEFEELRKHFPEYIKYKGSVNYDESVETLKNYFALVFPTLFYTEGIPGTIIDAYAAGLPVISSKWESYDDVIEDNITGIGYKFGSDDALVEALEIIKSNPQKIIDMKEACLQKAKDFSPATIVGGFIQKFF
ncbi:glycosyltransferase [Limosilactobacillus fermentum]